MTFQTGDEFYKKKDDKIKPIEEKKLKSISNDELINLILERIKEGKQILIFNNSKKSSETTAEKIASHIEITDQTEKDKVEKLSKEILNSLETPTSQCIKLAKCIKKGIAFHHSGLVTKQKVLIENHFRKGNIKAISSTPTLAAGLNLPAYKVIIKDYKRYTQRGMQDIPILEYHQMSGRAGRPGKEKEGSSVIYVKTEQELNRIVKKYIYGKPEEIISKLAIEPTLKMFTLSLISTDIINTKEEISTFFSSTLYAKQYGDLEELLKKIFKIIQILKEYEFVVQDDDYYTATPLGKKVSELYLNPDTAYFILRYIPKISKLFKNGMNNFNIYSLIHLITFTYEMKPLFRVTVSEKEIYEKKISNLGYKLLYSYDPYELDFEEFMNSLKTTDILNDWINEATEKYINERYNITPGEFKYRLERIDWLLYCLENLAMLKKELFLRNQINKLRQRFKYGIKEELLELITLKGIGKSRARKLYNAGYKRITDLKKTNYSKLIPILGEKTSYNILKQIRENPLEITNYPILEQIPKRITHKTANDVSDEEIERLLKIYNQFEEENKKGNLSLKEFF